MVTSWSYGENDSQAVDKKGSIALNEVRNLSGLFCAPANFAIDSNT